MFYEGCTLQEVKAYRELDGKPFDFGEGLIYPSNAMGSEDAYYEMTLQDEEADREYKQYQENMRALNCPSGQWYEDCHLCYSDVCPFSGRTKDRPNKYLRNRQHKKKQFKSLGPIEPIEEVWHHKYKFSCAYSNDGTNLYAYYDDKGQIYIKRLYKAKRIKWLKAYANRCVRRTKTQYGKGRTHCKEYDLWWNYD